MRGLVRVGVLITIDITRTFIMLEDTSGADIKILATMPGQNFTTDITSAEFSAFAWYQSAIANNSELVKIVDQTDPFNGGIEIVLGYAMGFQTGNLRGAFGVHFNKDAMEGLVDDLVLRATESGSNTTKTTSDQIGYYIYDSDKNLIISKDPFKTLESSPDIISNLTSNYTKGMIVIKHNLICLNIENRQVSYDVVKSGSGYKLRDVVYKSHAGAVFKFSATLSPYWLDSGVFTDYNFFICMIQTIGITHFYHKY